jgi:hypothetical protein
MVATESSNPFLSPADPAWDEAYLRVESYLRAYGIESPVLLNRLTAEIIAVARASPSESGADDPVAVAMQVTHGRIGAWFSRLGRPIDWADDRARAHGRLALIATGMPGHWADYFLSDQPVPVDLASAMANFEVLPGPELRLSNMAPEPLEFGFEGSEQRLPTRKWVPVRALVTWTVLFGCFGAAWAASH